MCKGSTVCGNKTTFGKGNMGILKATMMVRTYLRPAIPHKAITN